MTEIATPTNVLDDVMSSLRHLYHRPFRFFSNRPQKWSFWIMVTAFGGLCIFALLFNQVSRPQPQWVWWARLALLCALICYSSMAVHGVASMVGSLRLVLPPERILDPFIAAFTGELALIARLDQTYEHRALAYALDRLTLVVTQIRSRSALLIGALDKVGLIPVAVGAYFPLRGLFREQPPTPSEWQWIFGGVIGLGFIYVMTFGLLIWAQRLDEACVVLKHAMQAKPLVNPPLPSAPPALPAAAFPVQGANGGSRRRRRHRAKWWLSEAPCRNISSWPRWPCGCSP